MPCADDLPSQPAATDHRRSRHHVGGRSLSRSRGRRLIWQRTKRASALGAINSPTSVTLAGDEEALKAIGAALDDQKIFNRFLQVEVPYHSPQMDPIREELIQVVADAGSPQATDDSALFNGDRRDLIDGTTLTADYWWCNVREPVRFAEAIIRMHESILRPRTKRMIPASTHFLEVSPHPVLVRSIQESLAFI